MGYSILPAIPVTGLYMVTYLLYRTGFIGRALHVNLWNLVILLAFTISGIGGFVLMLLTEAGVKFYLNPQLLYWHVEAGIALIPLTVFHFHCYRGSLRRIVGVGK